MFKAKVDRKTANMAVLSPVLRLLTVWLGPFLEMFKIVLGDLR